MVTLPEMVRVFSGHVSLVIQIMFREVRTQSRWVVLSLGYQRLHFVRNRIQVCRQVLNVDIVTSQVHEGTLVVAVREVSSVNSDVLL